MGGRQLGVTVIFQHIKRTGQFEITGLGVEILRRHFLHGMGRATDLAFVGVQRIAIGGFGILHGGGGDVFRLFLAHRHFEIRLDTGFLDRAARRRVVAGGCQFDGAVVAEVDDALHRSLAEGSQADDCGALLVLQGAGDDFRRRGCTWIGQDHDRLAVQHVALFGLIADDVFRIAAALADDLATIEEQVCDADRLFQQAAGIVAQVEHETLHLRILGHQVGQLRLGVVSGGFREGSDAQVAVIAFHARLDRLHDDDFACQGHIERLGLAGADDGDGQLGIGLALHFGNGVIERQAEDRGAVDGGDIVARFDASLLGRGIVHRGDNLDGAVLASHFQTDAAVRAAGLFLQVVIIVVRQIVGMRIERGQHAFQSGIDQLL